MKNNNNITDKKLKQVGIILQLNVNRVKHSQIQKKPTTCLVKQLQIRKDQKDISSVQQKVVQKRLSKLIKAGI